MRINIEIYQDVSPNLHITVQTDTEGFFLGKENELDEKLNVYPHVESDIDFIEGSILASSNSQKDLACKWISQYLEDNEDIGFMFSYDQNQHWGKFLSYFKDPCTVNFIAINGVINMEESFYSYCVKNTLEDLSKYRNIENLELKEFPLQPDDIDNFIKILTVLDQLKTCKVDLSAITKEEDRIKLTEALSREKIKTKLVPFDIDIKSESLYKKCSDITGGQGGVKIEKKGFKM